MQRLLKGLARRTARLVAGAVVGFLVLLIAGLAQLVAVAVVALLALRVLGLPA